MGNPDGLVPHNGDGIVGDGAMGYRADVQRTNDQRGMEQGPYYDPAEGRLIIPSYVFNREASAEWKRRGMFYDALDQVWYRAVPAAQADEQVKRAREAYSRYWKLAEA